MKKIFLLFATVCTFFACDPVSEDISNGGHITADELKAMSTVTVDVAPDGKNGNVVSCTTSAPVNAKWSLGGKEFYANSAWKKMKVGEHTVTLTGLCPDGTVVTADFPVKCEVITQALEKIYLYGDPAKGQEPFVLESEDAGGGRFSDNEGKYLPYLSDDVYWGKKTLIFDIIETTDGPFIWAEPKGSGPVGCTVRVMNGWWSATYKDDVPLSVGLWELPLTEEIAKDCAKGNGGAAKDLDLLMTRGSVKIRSVYYEE